MVAQVEPRTIMPPGSAGKVTGKRGMAGLRLLGPFYLMSLACHLLLIYSFTLHPFSTFILEDRTLPEHASLSAFDYTRDQQVNFDQAIIPIETMDSRGWSTCTEGDPKVPLKDNSPTTKPSPSDTIVNNSLSIIEHFKK
jgi:hypothetical protein